MNRITIRDLAKMLNISSSTVSRALSDHPDISKATKERVRAAAEEFNYTANLHASFFRKKRSGLIALILPEIYMFYAPNLIGRINKILTSSGYSLTVFFTNDSLKREKEIVKQCMAWAVEGVMISLSRESKNVEHLEPFLQVGIKCVLFDKTLANDYFPTVTIDNVKSAYKAVSHLIEKGHRNILGIFDNPNYRTTQERMLGYRQALLDNNLPILEENIIAVDKTSDLQFILPPILKHNKDIQAIFTMSDELLFNAHFHIQAVGMSIPKDISIIAISDGEYPYFSFPNISFIKDSGSKTGKKTCDILLDLIDGKIKEKDASLMISTKLVELNSVRDLN